MRVPMIVRMLGTALKSWWADDVPRLGASLAYYTLFSLAPILVIAIAIAGFVFGEEAVRGQIVSQIDQLVGHDGAEAVQGLVEGASRRETGGIIATIVGSVTFLIAATGAFLELQAALNTIWRVKPTPGVNVEAFLLARLRSFGLVVAMGFLLLVSLAVSAALSALGGWISRSAPGWPVIWQVVNVIVSLTVITAVFAMVYRFLPDVKLRWRDVWTGAFVTALLFSAGKQLIGLYLGQSSTASSYGAAGSVVILLLWVYYSAQVILLGAEFTRVYTRRNRSAPRPEVFAEKEKGGKSAGK